MMLARKGRREVDKVSRDFSRKAGSSFHGRSLLSHVHRLASSPAPPTPKNRQRGKRKGSLSGKKV